MKLFKVMLFSLLSGMAIGGCQKDDENSENDSKKPSVAVSRIALITIYDEEGVTTKSYQYDKNGLMTYEQVRRNGKDHESTSVAYSDHKAIITHSYLYDREWTRELTCSLNDMGLVTSITYKSSDGDGDKETFAADYNKDGYLAKLFQTYYDGATKETFFTVEDGNVIRKEIRGSNEVIIETSSFYTDKTNTIGCENTGFVIYGRQSKNLIKSSTHHNKEVTYTYEFDSKNRVTKQLCSDGSYTEYTYIE